MNPMTPKSAFTIKVPRKAFTGWFLAVRAFKDAGLSDVTLAFAKGELHLLAAWGETRITYQGNFTGTVVISAKRMLMLTKKAEKMIEQPLPVVLKVYPDRNLLGVDLIELPAKIEVDQEQLPAEPRPKNAATAVGITIQAADLLQLIKQVSPTRPDEKLSVRFIASETGLTVQSTKGHAQRDAFILGSGSWVVSLKVMLGVLQTYSPTAYLTIEVYAKGMKINSFSMPLLAWDSI
jgi:hypothetical protein